MSIDSSGPTTALVIISTAESVMIVLGVKDLPMANSGNERLLTPFILTSKWDVIFHFSSIYSFANIDRTIGTSESLALS